MYVDGRDSSVAPHLMMRGMWEPWITMAIAKHVRPGMRCIDIGSNLGYYTLLLAALVGREGHVLAVEPNQALIQLAHRTMSVNGVTDQVSFLHCAASDEPFIGELVIPAYLHGGAYIRRVDNAPVNEMGDPTTAGHVICGPLDRCPSVHLYDWDFIKIDVEGMERAVLEGLAETLDRLKHVTIAVEVTPYHWNDDLEGFLTALQMKGYSVEMIAEDDKGSIVPLDYAELPKEQGKWKMLWIKK